MKVIFLDIETTGIKPTHKHYIWQVAWIVAKQENKTLKLLKAKEKLLLPFGKKHPKRLFSLIEDLKHADLMVAHNADFERSFLYEYGIWIPRKKSYCTMEKSKDLCNIKYCIPDYYGWDRHLVFTKYPKLREAAEILLKEKVDQNQLHNALYDVMLTAKIYAYLESLQIDTSSLKVHKQPQILKKLYRLLFSPLEPYETIRQNIKNKLSAPIKTLIKLKDRIKIKEEPLPF
ncbi:MAG: exonuclease domain-containing protein [Desulfurococcaceae archaeon]